jgi:GLPGLI family protein
MRYFIILLFVIINIQAHAQITKATVLFVEAIYPRENLPPDASNWASMVPEKIETFKYLHFDGEESLYKIGPESEIPDELLENRWMQRMLKARQSEQIYFDKGNNMSLSTKNFFGKDFLVQDSIPVKKWKIVASEQRIIAGYTCMKAITADSIETEAWFTPQLPASFGPEDYHGLPGLILALNIPDTKIILAREVYLNELKENIDKPKSGEKVTREKYNQIVDERMAEMRSMGRGGGRFFR